MAQDMARRTDVPEHLPRPHYQRELHAPRGGLSSGAETLASIIYKEISTKNVLPASVEPPPPPEKKARASSQLLSKTQQALLSSLNLEMAPDARKQPPEVPRVADPWTESDPWSSSGPKVQGAKVEPKREEAKVEEPTFEKVQATKIEEPKVQGPGVEEEKVEELKVEEPRVEEEKVEEPKVEPRVEEEKVEALKMEEPEVEEPKVHGLREPKVEVTEVEVTVEEPKVEEPLEDVQPSKPEPCKEEPPEIQEASCPAEETAPLSVYPASELLRVRMPMHSPGVTCYKTRLADSHGHLLDSSSSLSTSLEPRTTWASRLGCYIRFADVE